MKGVAAKRPMSLDTPEMAKDEIEQLLHDSPRRHGISRSRWRLKDIRQVISWLKDCTLAGVHQILKRLKICLKQATGYVRSPDPDRHLKRRRMAQAFSAALHQPQEYVILFQDELTYYSQQNEGLKYGAVGQKSPYVAHGAAENKMTRIGAVMDGLTGQVIYTQADKFGKLAMADLYRMIRQHYPKRKVFVVQDNCPFHYSDNVLATADELDIIPVYLPTYASWLNPIEKLWRWLKADILRGHEFTHDPLKLQQVVAEFLDQFANGSSALLRYVGLLPI
jgi:hypothetical protein